MMLASVALLIVAFLGRIRVEPEAIMDLSKSDAADTAECFWDVNQVAELAEYQSQVLPSPDEGNVCVMVSYYKYVSKRAQEGKDSGWMVYESWRVRDLLTPWCNYAGPDGSNQWPEGSVPFIYMHGSADDTIFVVSKDLAEKPDAESGRLKVGACQIVYGSKAMEDDIKRDFPEFEQTLLFGCSGEDRMGVFNPFENGKGSNYWTAEKSELMSDSLPLY